MSFSLIYAGVPLCLDGAFSFCIPNSKDSNPVIPDRLKGILKHEPEVDLIDELERVAPFVYAEEFSFQNNYPGKNLGAIADIWNASPPKTQIRIGDFFYPNSASRWSVFRGLVGTSQKNAILAVTQGNQSKTFSLQSDINIGSPASNPSNASLSTSMFMLPPRLLSKYGTQFDGLWLITLVDDRFYMQNTGISFKKSDLLTWDTLIASFASQAGITVNYSTIPTAYGTPESDSPLWANGESTATLLDAIAFNIGRTVVRNLDGTYSLLTPAESQTRVQSNVSNVPTTQGGEILYSGALSRNSIVPSSITVTFPKYVTGDDPVPHFLNSRTQKQRQSTWYEDSYGEVHSVTIPITSGGSFASGLSGTSTQTIHSTAKALLSGEIQSIPYNASGLTALALQIASDQYTTSIIGIDQTFAGLYSFSPDGLHDIVWTYSQKSKGAFSRIVKNSWNSTIWERQHSLSISGSTNYPRGVGGKSVAQSICDSVSGLANTFAIANSLTSGGMNVSLPSVDGLPTNNRFFGTIENESIFFEGCSGGIYSGGLFNLDIVYRGINGTIQTSHNSGTTFTKTQPDKTHGVNVTTYGKGQFAFPNTWSSGGIQEVKILPQIQNVKVLDATGTIVSGITYYSGRVLAFDPLQLSGQQYTNQEYVWVTERNNGSVSANSIYDGLLIGFSPTITAQGGNAPIYNVSQATATATILGQAEDLPVPAIGPFGTVDIVHAPLYSGFTSGLGTTDHNIAITLSGDSSNSRLRFAVDNLGTYTRVNSGTSFLRRRINFVNGSGTIASIVDSSGLDEVIVRYDTSGGGGSSLIVDLTSGSNSGTYVSVNPDSRLSFDASKGFTLKDLGGQRGLVGLDFKSGSPTLSSGDTFITQITNIYSQYSGYGRGFFAQGGSDWNFFKRVSTDNYHLCSQPLMAGAVTSFTVTPEAFVAIPFIETRGGSLDRITFYWTTPSTLASGRIRFGIYGITDPLTLYPGALVTGTDTGAIDVSPSGALAPFIPIAVDSAITAVLPPGMYYAVMRTDSAAHYGGINPFIHFRTPTATNPAMDNQWTCFGVSDAVNGLDLSVANINPYPQSWTITGQGADAPMPANFPNGAFLTTYLSGTNIVPIIFRRYNG